MQQSVQLHAGLECSRLFFLLGLGLGLGQDMFRRAAERERLILRCDLMSRPTCTAYVHRRVGLFFLILLLGVWAGDGFIRRMQGFSIFVCRCRCSCEAMRCVSTWMDGLQALCALRMKSIQCLWGCVEYLCMKSIM